MRDQLIAPLLRYSLVFTIYTSWPYWLIREFVTYESQTRNYLCYNPIKIVINVLREE